MPTDWNSWIIGALTIAVLALIIHFNRRRYQALATLFPTPVPLPTASPVDLFEHVDGYLEVPAKGSSSGGSGHTVSVAEAGFRLQGSRIWAGGRTLWFPWERVATCQAVTGINPGGESNPPGVEVVLKAGAATIRLADPAGDRVLGYWRQYQRRLRTSGTSPTT